MMNDERTIARSIINQINSYDAYTTYTVTGDRLYVERKHDALLPAQIELINKHKALLIEYLTSPPAQTGNCVHGHTVMWTCTQHGTWVCACYYNKPAQTEPRPPAQTEKPKTLVTMHDYRKSLGAKLNERKKKEQVQG